MKIFYYTYHMIFEALVAPVEVQLFSNCLLRRSKAEFFYGGEIDDHSSIRIGRELSGKKAAGKRLYTECLQKAFINIIRTRQLSLADGCTLLSQADITRIHDAWIVNTGADIMCLCILSHL